MRRPYDAYTELFLDVYQRMERWLLRLLIGFGLLLVISQLLLQIPYVRNVMVKVERLEGKPFSVQLVFATKGQLWYNE